MDRNLRSRQLNPCDPLFWKCRGYHQRPSNWQQILENAGFYECSNEAFDNNLRSRQLNPLDDLFWISRGYSRRPQNWRQILGEMGYYNGYSDDESDQNSDCSVYSETDSEYEEQCQRSNSNNPNNDEYWRIRGFAQRPHDWRERIRRN